MEEGVTCLFLAGLQVPGYWPSDSLPSRFQAQTHNRGVGPIPEVVGCDLALFLSFFLDIFPLRPYFQGFCLITSSLSPRECVFPLRSSLFFVTTVCGCYSFVIWQLYALFLPVILPPATPGNLPPTSYKISLPPSLPPLLPINNP